MINLAGRQDCDTYILTELAGAGIDAQAERNNRSEVPYGFIGRVGDFTFRRAWYYWVVSGSVPLAVARELYANPIGKEDVRVAGHCGCPPPDEWERGGFVDTYHIDSQAGLNLFVATLRKHGLAD